MPTTPQTIKVSTPIEAYRLAGSMAGRLGCTWVANSDYTKCVVARSTHPVDTCKANRIATITTKGNAK